MDIFLILSVISVALGALFYGYGAGLALYSMATGNVPSDLNILLAEIGVIAGLILAALGITGLCIINPKI